MSAQHPTPMRLATFSDDELGRGESREIEHHLQDCAHCRAELEALRTLSVRLADFALPDDLGQDLWEQVQPQLPDQLPEARPLAGGFLRWLPPLGLVAFNTVLQATLIVATFIWSLSRAGLLDLRTMGSGWLPATAGLSGGPLLETIGSVLRWFLIPPLWPGLDALTRASGVDLSGLLSWLLPSGLVLALSVGLTLLYLGWLVACWNVRSRPIRQVARAA